MEKITEKIVIGFLYMCAFLVILIPESWYVVSPWYAIPMLAIPSLYLMLQLVQVCISGAFNRFQWLLLIVLSLIWFSLGRRWGYPLSQFIGVSWGFLGIIFTLFYLYKHHRISNFIVIWLLLFSAFILINGYQLITSQKLF